ncbi:MAG: TRAP transporter small permease [Candidatus Adiutrix sp.]|nr:TRAP transporter small permease [Candidatus Adiutrix sp.]
MKIVNLIDRWFEESLIAVFMGYFVLATIFQVISRLILHWPAAWTEETSRYAFIWMTFVGSAVAVKNASHVRVDVLENALKSETAKNLFFWFTTLTFLVFCASLTVIGFNNCLTLLKRPQMMPVLGQSMIYVYSAMPVGMGLSVLRLLQLMWRKVKGGLKPAREVVE